MTITPFDGLLNRSMNRVRELRHESVRADLTALERQRLTAELEAEKRISSELFQRKIEMQRRQRAEAA